MFSKIVQSLSGESPEKSSPTATNSPTDGDSQETKTPKRNRSGEDFITVDELSKSQKRKRFTSRKKKSTENVRNEDGTSSTTLPDNEESANDLSADLPPEETTDWGIKLLEILQRTIQSEIRSVKSTIEDTEVTSKNNTIEIKKVESKLKKIEKHNKQLSSENHELKERLLDLEFQQHRNNLIFEGIVGAQDETDLQCIEKLQFVVKDIPGLDVANFRIDRCQTRW